MQLCPRIRRRCNQLRSRPIFLLGTSESATVMLPKRNGILAWHRDDRSGCAHIDDRQILVLTLCALVGKFGSDWKLPTQLPTHWRIFGCSN